MFMLKDVLPFCVDFELLWIVNCVCKSHRKYWQEIVTRVMAFHISTLESSYFSLFFHFIFNWSGAVASYDSKRIQNKSSSSNTKKKCNNNRNTNECVRDEKEAFGCQLRNLHIINLFECSNTSERERERERERRKEWIKVEKERYIHPWLLTEDDDDDVHVSCFDFFFHLVFVAKRITIKGIRGFQKLLF
jgi:hypothetical protein